MQLKKIVVLVAALFVALASYRAYGWPGLVLAAGGVVMWQLLHFTRMLQILKRAAKRPIGYVDSAVMLHAKLVPGQPLLHVVALTQSLGQLESAKETQPEHYRWTDASQHSVLCVFLEGRLQHWELTRSAAAVAVAQPQGSAPAP